MNGLPLFLVDCEDTSPVATITVNIPDERISGANCNFVDTISLPTILETFAVIYWKDLGQIALHILHL